MLWASKVSLKVWRPPPLATKKRYFVAAGASGVASVLLLRDDLDPAASWHFRVCVPVVLLMTAGWWTSRRLPQDAGARRLHPVIGLVAMLGGLVGGFLGLGMLP